MNPFQQQSQQRTTFINQQNNQQYQNQVQNDNKSELKFYHEFSIAQKFGVIFTFVSQDKVGKDGVPYTSYGVLIKVIPSGNEPMTYDSANAFTLKTSLEQVATLSGALLSIYYGQPVEFTIFTDSSKSQYANENVKKQFRVTNIDPNTKQMASDRFYVAGYISNNKDIKAGMALSRFDAYAWHKMLDEFVKKAMEIIFENRRG